MTEEPIRIARDDLFNPEVDKALARQRSGRERVVADPPPVSAFRRLMNNSLFYLPIAAILAAFVTWRLLEPAIVDRDVERRLPVLDLGLGADPAVEAQRVAAPCVPDRARP